MLRLAFDFIITWRETRTRPNAYRISGKNMVEVIIPYRKYSFIIYPILLLIGALTPC